MDGDCDIDTFRAKLQDHKPHSAIIMAGGGKFNDHYWEDQPPRMKMIESFTDYPIRAFPQSVWMRNPERIDATKEAFSKHKDLQLAVRDRPSWEWLDKTFSTYDGIQSDLVPDIAFMWGNRSDFRTNTEKTYVSHFKSILEILTVQSHDILILARKDMEISEGDSSEIPYGDSELDLGGRVGKVKINKIDWKFTETPDINGPTEQHPNWAPAEKGKNQIAWAKSIEGFRELGSARFVITDRLHGHILSTIIGVPHVLMDSKLCKNLHFHNTWTRDCECTRITSSIGDAKIVARMWFEKHGKVDST